MYYIKSKLSCVLVLAVVLITSVTGCQREPQLFLHGEGEFMTDMPEIELELRVMWNYEFDYNFAYDWQSEWEYGWDTEDESLFGKIGYTEPEYFEVRRYFLGNTPGVSHTKVDEYNHIGHSLTTSYEFGYYDFLVWNTIIPGAGDVQSLIINEENLDNVTAYTNKTMYTSQSGMYKAPASRSTRYQPEELFSVGLNNIYISNAPADYDYYDEVKRVYYKKLNGTLQPIVYIYLVQVILHNNNGRITATDGNNVLTGMAEGVSVTTAQTFDTPTNVYFNTRMKKGVVLKGTSHKGSKADIIGGRLTTFGLCSTNPYYISTRASVNDKQEHFLEVTAQFNNGKDSTFVFDVTKQVRDRYKGGVITVELDVDTVKIPRREGGSGFDAKVEDPDSVTYEFGM